MAGFIAQGPREASANRGKREEIEGKNLDKGHMRHVQVFNEHGPVEGTSIRVRCQQRGQWEGFSAHGPLEGTAMIAIHALEQEHRQGFSAHGPLEGTAIILVYREPPKQRLFQRTWP